MILVTGGTGMFGSRIVSELTARQVPVRVMARDLARARSVLGPDVELIQADMDRPASLPEALRGVDRVFLVSPMDQRLADREIAVIDAAVQARVDWVVKVHGAVRHQQDPADPLVQLHQAPIDRLRQSGLKWALLSPQTVMESNFLPYAAQISATGEVWGCCGDARIGFVSADDVGRAGAVVLTDRNEPGVNYEITGPQALSWPQVAAIFSRVLNRPVSYRDLPEADIRQILITQGGFTEDDVDIRAMVHFHALRMGWADLVTDTYQQLTGRQATSVEEWITAHAPVFGAGAPASA